MNNLGDGIKKLRKRKNKTLTDIAGDKISVSMLSLIENNKSKPSMETLNYIADRLETNLSELVAGEKNVFTEMLWGKVDDFIKAKGYNNPQLYELIESNLNQVSNSIHGAKIYKTYAYLQIIKGNQELARKYIKKAEAIYKSYGLADHVIVTRIDMALFQFASNNYTLSLEALLDIKEKIDVGKYVVDNDSINIKILHLLGALYAAIGDLVQAKRYLDDCINLSTESGDFSNTSETFRLRVIISIFENDLDTCNAYINKLGLLVKITSNNSLKYSLYFVKMNYEYLINDDPLRMLGLFEAYKNELNYDHEIMEKIYNSYIYLLVGIAYFKLGDNDKAFNYFQMISTKRPLANHPIDICIRSELEAYKARIYQAKGVREKALYYSKLAMNATEDYSNNPYKEFITKTYDFIRKSNTHLTGGSK